MSNIGSLLCFYCMMKLVEWSEFDPADDRDEKLIQVHQNTCGSRTISCFLFVHGTCHKFQMEVRNQRFIYKLLPA